MPGLVCEEHRRSGMKPVSPAARELAERFTRTSLDKLELGPELRSARQGIARSRVQLD